MKSLVLSCSKRFKDEANTFVKPLEDKGIIVFKPPLYEWDEELLNLKPEHQIVVASGLTHNHFQRIREAEVMFVYNKNGYIGNSVTLEMGFAAALGRPIYALAHDPNELCRESLISQICDSWKQLLAKLN